MSTKRARVDDSMEFPDQTDKRNLTTCVTLNSSHGQLVGPLANAEDSEYTFTFPPSFSVYRNKSCSIKVISASVVYDSASAQYGELATSIDLATNIQVQGLCLNFPNANNEQVVQVALEISTVQNTFGAHGLQPFYATNPDSATFRCQALPDKIALFMLRTNSVSKKISKRAPNHASMTLQIDFDEPI
tara:strand:+ start:550 stop:1113 length:564 start_codon:yes stop_codon:yes gene_type:complete